MIECLEPERRHADQAEAQLSARDQELLGFEREWWRVGELKPVAVRQRFGMSVADYHRALNALIDRAGALAHDPLLVRRLRRQRERRREERGRRHA